MKLYKVELYSIELYSEDWLSRYGHFPLCVTVTISLSPGHLQSHLYTHRLPQEECQEWKEQPERIVRRQGKEGENEDGRIQRGFTRSESVVDIQVSTPSLSSQFLHGSQTSEIESEKQTATYFYSNFFDNPDAIYDC